MGKKPWSNQKMLQIEGRIPSLEQMRYKILSIGNLRDRALLALTYLTAGRIGEVIRVKRDDISRTFRSGRDVLLVRLSNNKNKKRPYKEIPIPLDREPLLTDVIMTYLETTKKDEWIFGFRSNARAYQIIQKYGWNPHWLRHLRLTHLVQVYDFSDQLLVKFAGWVDSKPAKHYIELRWGDFLDKY